MNLLKRDEQPLKSSNDVVVARQKVRQWATELKFSLVDQTKLVTAASELARNALDHGRGGAMIMEMITTAWKDRAWLTFEDQGPGIPDIERAWKDGFTTGSGMGTGFRGSKRLVNEFSIEIKSLESEPR